MRNFIKFLQKEQYIHWEISPVEHVLLFKNDNRFLLSHCDNKSLISVVFDINEEEVDIKEIEGIDEKQFDFNIFYSNIQKLTQNVDGILI